MEAAPEAPAPAPDPEPGSPRKKRTRRKPAPEPAPPAPPAPPRLDAEFWTHFMRESRATREAARRERIHSLLRS